MSAKKVGKGVCSVFGTTAHEFQHMIHYAHGYPEMTFINEGLSEIAEYVCGYGRRSNGLYASNTNVNLLSWDQTGNVLEDYSRAALWMLYVYEQFGTDILKDFVDNQHGDWGAIETRLQTYDANRGFWTFFLEWLVANYANGYSSERCYKCNHFNEFNRPQSP